MASRSTEERVTDLEQEFRLTDYKLDALIDSVKEVNIVVKQLADIANTQSMVQQQFQQLYKDHSELKKSVADDKDRLVPFIDQGKAHMSTVKVWSLVAFIGFGIVQTIVFNSVGAAKDYIIASERRMVEMEKQIRVLEIRPAPQPSTQQ